ncbi:MAG: hypothetical protein AAGE86_10515, partial [Pseudomonadota bacterium]
MLISTAMAIVMLQASAAEPAAAPAPQAAATACSAEEFAAFDFWVGEWEVFPAGGEDKVADSTIRRLSSGCAVHEHWQPLSGQDGTSLTLKSHDSGRWEQ